MLAAGDGNISFRLDQSKILITPSGVNKRWLVPSEMALVTLHGEPVVGNPSSELPMHLAIYQSNSKAKAVVHAHPPHAIAWSIARPDDHEIPVNCISETILGVGKIPIVPYARPGSDKMADVVKTCAQQHRVMILARHGALSWGESLAEAYNGIERIEHSTLILKLASDLGALTELPSEEIEKLILLRKELGPISR
jgi:L-fuculose-phosphate aldolase